MLSKTSSYAIQALVYLTVHVDGREFVPISEVATSLGIPYHFLKKIVTNLVQAGLLQSQRSARGGIALVKSPELITLRDIINALGEDQVFHQCILGLPGCGEQKPCILHAAWALERQRLDSLFSSASLKSVAEEVRQGHLRMQ